MINFFMKMNVFLKFLITVALLLGSVTNVAAAENSSQQTTSITSDTENLTDLFKQRNNVQFEQNGNEQEVYFESNEIEINEELIEEFHSIDVEAQSYFDTYFDFYKEHGYFPEKKVLTNRLASSASYDVALNLLKGYGVNWTKDQLIARLATLGAIASLDGPIPIGDFVALLAGAVILNPNLDNYIANLDEITNYLKSVSLRNAISKVTGAVSLSIATRKEIKKGKKHFEAWLSTGGWGGIFIGRSISLSEAQSRARNGLDTFSVSKESAKKVVKQTNYWYYDEGGHITLGYLANLPHYHMTTDEARRNKLPGHHFFPYDPLD
ncbi:hypothetical protein AV540_16440 [Brevibacillus parabrevis]|nr:hypothetical protein AV540_16440 [Brevibacillus parabrevis]